MTDLPHAEEPFAGVINPLAKDSTPAKPSIHYPPAGAPNVVVVLLDDVGFGAASHLRRPGADPGARPDRRHGVCATTSSTRPRCARRRAQRC